jgi:hypothetical protein
MDGSRAPKRTWRTLSAIVIVACVVIALAAAPGSSQSVSSTPETAPALALAGAAWYQALALCEVPQLESSSSPACTSSLEQLYEEALNGVSSPDPNWKPIALPQSAGSVGPGPCQLSGQRARRVCPAVVGALAGIGSSAGQAVAIGRALVITTGRQQGALQFGTANVAAVQLAALAVDGGEQAPVLALQHERALALATALQAVGSTLTVTRQQETSLMLAIRTLSGRAATAAHAIARIGFPIAQMHSAAALALSGIRPRSDSVVSLLQRPFPSTAPMLAAYNAMGPPQFVGLLAEMAATGGIQEGAAASLTKAFKAAEAAPNPAAGQAAIRKLIKLAQHTAGVSGQFLAAAARPFAATFQPLPAPVAVITSPTNGSSYALNANVPTQFSCSGDVVSCVDSAGVTGGTGTVYTKTAGPQTYTVTATGPADNTGVATVSYTVNRAPTKLTTPALAATTGGLGLATLTVAGTGAPIEAETISFTSGKTQLCSGTTDISGVAACQYPSSDALMVAATGYTATFAGDANYTSSSASATL